MSDSDDSQSDYEGYSTPLSFIYDINHPIDSVRGLNDNECDEYSESDDEHDTENYNDNSSIYSNDDPFDSLQHDKNPHAKFYNKPARKAEHSTRNTRASTRDGS